MGLKEEQERAKDYALETINEKLVKLNLENVAKIEAILKIDSNYKNAKKKKKKPDEEYIKFIKKAEKDNDEFTPKLGAKGGSGAYWIDQFVKMIKDNKEESADNYLKDEIIKGIVCMIDKENKTHLNSTKKIKGKEKLEKIGRKNVKEIIAGIENKELEKLLKNPKDNNYEIIDRIAKGKGDYGEKTYYSFATKFCHYVCLQMFEGTEEADNFASYDKYVSENLPKYYEYYVGKKIEKIQKPKDNFGEAYKKYIDIIDEIREAAQVKEGDKDKISRNGMDHLLWYFHKGE